MANTHIEAKRIAREALPILSDNLVAPNLMYKDYSADFAKQGDTIQVKRPSIFTANDFPVGGAISIQDLNRFPVLVTMDKIADVSVQLTAREMALNFEGFNAEVLEPAVVAIAEKINSTGLEMASYIPYWVGASGTTPATLEPIANAMRMLNVNKCPLPTRRAVWDPYAEAKLLQLDTLVEADKSGSTAALRESAMGRVYGFNNFMSQGVYTHTAGEYTALADVTAAITAANNAIDPLTGFTYSSAVLTSAAGVSVKSLEAGDLLTIAGKQKVVIADTAAAIAGVVTAKVYPPEPANVAAGAVVFADVTAGAHTSNLAFHEKAFAFVTRPLTPAMGVESYTAAAGDLSLRVSIGYDMSSKKQTMSIDTLYGYAPLYPEFACQILG
jgi:hypothetical protein